MSIYCMRHCVSFVIYVGRQAFDVIIRMNEVENKIVLHFCLYTYRYRHMDMVHSHWYLLNDTTIYKSYTLYTIYVSMDNGSTIIIIITIVWNTEVKLYIIICIMWFCVGFQIGRYTGFSKYPHKICHTRFIIQEGYGIQPPPHEMYLKNIFFDKVM